MKILKNIVIFIGAALSGVAASVAVVFVAVASAVLSALPFIVTGGALIILLRYMGVI